MKPSAEEKTDGYYSEASSWSADREASAERIQRIAWIMAAVLALLALIEGIALVCLLPLKTVVPYTILVDRQTGNVQALRPLEEQSITPDDALVRSFLAQYVTAREGFDIGTLKADYRKIALWSAGEARDRYLSSMQATNPLSPLATLPRQTTIATEVLSISSLSADTALVRYRSTRSDPGANSVAPSYWVAVLTYKFSDARMSEADRLLNPLGFQVLRYRRSAETVLPTPPAPDRAEQGAEMQ